MFVWLRTPDGTDAMRLYEKALEGRLVVMPGHPFHVRGGENTIRLNYATPTEEQIQDGMRVLGSACRELGYPPDPGPTPLKPLTMLIMRFRRDMYGTMPSSQLLNIM